MTKILSAFVGEEWANRQYEGANASYACFSTIKYFARTN